MALSDDTARRRLQRRVADAAPPDDAPLDAAPPPSKTRRKAAMHALQDLGAELVELDARRFAELCAAVDLPERLVDAIRDAHAINSWGARKRQLQYIGKLMRDVDAEPIRQRIDAWAHGRDEQTTRSHGLERLRESLLAEPGALDRLALAHPALDRARIEALIAQARVERDEGRPPHAYRELFRALKSLDPR